MKYIIISSKVWNAQLPAKLEEELPEHSFSLISDQDDFTLARIQSIDPAAIFVVHWSHLIPDEIINASECVVFHMTDLPFGRGGSPLQNLIVRGLKETKISALKAVAELDAGDIYLKHDLSLEGTAEEIFMRANGVIEDMIKEIIVQSPELKPQTGEVVTFKRRSKEDGRMNELSDLNTIFDYIRMLDAPTYPKAYIELDDVMIEFTNAKKSGEIVEANVRIIKK